LNASENFRAKDELIVESLEQVRKRPKDNQEQEKYYSGKACKHTLKSQIIILPEAML
jgi:hypothetical protein